MAEQSLTEQSSTEQSTAEQRMNPDDPTIYDIWKPADGIFKGEAVAKWITFVSSRKDRAGWVKVIGGEEGYAKEKSRKFYIPAGHNFEVLGCKIMFTRA